MKYNDCIRYCRRFLLIAAACCMLSGCRLPDLPSDQGTYSPGELLDYSDVVALGELVSIDTVAHLGQIEYLIGSYAATVVSCSFQQLEVFKSPPEFDPNQVLHVWSVVVTNERGDSFGDLDLCGDSVLFYGRVVGTPQDLVFVARPIVIITGVGTPQLELSLAAETEPGRQLIASTAGQAIANSSEAEAAFLAIREIVGAVLHVTDYEAYTMGALCYERLSWRSGSSWYQWTGTRSDYLDEVRELARERGQQ